MHQSPGHWMGVFSMSKTVIGKPAVRPCWHCGTFEGIVYRPSMTAYDFKGEPDSDEDPNRAHEMCEPCWSEYEAHWQAMWDEVRKEM